MTLPCSEVERQEALARLDVLDSVSGPIFDNFTKIAAMTFSTPIAAISLVTSERQWFKSQIGLNVSETAKDNGFCDHTLQRDQPLIVPDAAADARFRDSPLVTGEHAIRFYAGAPLISADERRMGALCVMDTQARFDFRDDQAHLLQTIANGVSDALQLGLEARANASAARYQRLADTANDIVTEADLDGRFTYISPSVQHLFGYLPDELEGSLYLDFVHPEDRDRVLEDFRAAVTHDPGRRIEFRCLGKHGRVIWVESRPRLVLDDVTGQSISVTDVLRDITDRKAAEFALAQSEQHFRLICDNATDIIMRFTASGRLSYISPAVTAALQYTPSELLGRRLFEFLHPDDLDQVMANVAAFMATGSDSERVYYEYRMRAKDGAYVWLEAHPVKTYDPTTGELNGFQDVVRVVTDRKAVEVELERARDAAIAATTAKSEFLATMSHEIRTPLTAIIGFASLLRDRKDLPESAQLQVRRIESAGSALQAIVNDVLDFSKIEAGAVNLAPQAVSPESILRDTAALFTAQAGAKSLFLELVIEEPLPKCVRLDPNRFGQILFNLIGNAIKFTDQGGVTLVASYDQRLNTLKVLVEDTGPGLDDRDLPRLFDRFSQCDMSSTRKHGGAGLGLAISKGLVERMGGSIAAESKVGAGSTFRFEICAPVAEGVAVSAPDRDDVKGLSGLRVLIADDNPHIRELAKTMLETNDAEVFEATDGESCLRYATVQPFDVILLDYRMPDLDGVEVLRRLRGGPGPNQNIPVIAFTAESDIGYWFKTAGFDHYISKPISVSDLIATVIEAVSWETNYVSNRA